jgi:hypothetical protein
MAEIGLTFKNGGIISVGLEVSRSSRPGSWGCCGLVGDDLYVAPKTNVTFDRSCR